MKIDIRPKVVDEELALRSMRLVYDEIEVETPYKTSTVKASYGLINEAFSRYNWTSLNNILESTTHEKNANALLKGKISDGINITFSDYQDGIIPNSAMIRTMAQIQYAHTDVVTTPLWSGVISTLVRDGEYLSSKLINLNNEFIDYIQTRNNKSIWGVIPYRLPRLYLRDYIKSMIDREITSFIVDFNNASVVSNPSWLLELLDAVKEYKLLESAIFYAVNANEGRFSKKADVIPAKDFLCCGFDFDLLGQNNVPIRGNKDFFKSLKNRRLGETLMSYREFDRASYGYKRRESTSQDVIDTSKRVNIRRQVEESESIRQYLFEENSVESYILTKESVPEELIKDSKWLHKELYGREKTSRQTTLI